MSDISKNELVSAVANIEEQVVKIIQAIKQNTNGNLNLCIVLLLGLTGAGKTTLIHSLTNKVPIGKKEGHKKFLVAADPDPNFVISSKGVSETTTPMMVLFKVDNLYVVG